ATGLEKVSEEFLYSLQIKLEPVFHEFYELQVSKFVTDNLRDFFLWKSNIDERRAALSELGFTTIDAHFASLKSYHHVVVEEGGEASFWPQFSAVEKNILDSSTELATITNLEERALQFFDLIQDTTSFSPDAFLRLDQLLTDLKGETEQLKATTHPTMLESFKVLHDSLHRAEKLLKKRKQDDDEPREGEGYS